MEGKRGDYLTSLTF